MKRKLIKSLLEVVLLLGFLLLASVFSLFYDGQPMRNARQPSRQTAAGGMRDCLCGKSRQTSSLQSGWFFCYHKNQDRRGNGRNEIKRTVPSEEACG
ncbi:hypothetical protein HMP0721_1350 [Pseudoramibacter alactolyticus ATCC 23263]|uniref:Uncharacterized protein n=1 Tax=Pseudoramibacter alactolyticus ATCC 23263 TaxID=887929 RepID=E6MH65_9FIRM|nr:hypothetical protein [Pseudoramibacter alactolyticus]EFV01955.1 hypothetical protein HMP0721_1350 [Pseudoramibacter alactolyticus ATCC 23263]